jgi:hypothetical protein
VDVLAIDRRHKRRVQALDDVVRQRIALGFDLLDLQRGVPGRGIRRQHAFEQRGPGNDSVGQGDEVGEELFFFGNQAEAHDRKYVTRLLRRCYFAGPARVRTPPGRPNAVFSWIYQTC